MSQLIGVSADIALLLDEAGVVQKVSMSRSDWASLDCRSWVGRPWLDTFAEDSLPKLPEMLAAKAGEELRWRHINHRSQVPGGSDVPLQYVAVPLVEEGMSLVLGRDMSIVAGLQQRLMDAQQSMERDYMRLRHMEARYRILFETSGEPVLVVDVAAGISPSVMSILSACHYRLIVLRDEPSSIADAYGTIKVMTTELGLDEVYLVPNMVPSQGSGWHLFKRMNDVCTRFLGLSVNYLTSIEADELIMDGLRKHQSVLTFAPGSSGARDFRRLGELVLDLPALTEVQGQRQFFFERLLEVTQEG